MNQLAERIKRNQQIFINTNQCRYELDTLQYVIAKNGFQEIRKNNGAGNILWYGSALRDNDLDTIKRHNDSTLFNRYPLMDHFAKKNIMSVILSRLQRFFPLDFEFVPEYYLLPDECDELESHMLVHPGQTFIAKPSKGKAGQGIKLLNYFDELPKASFESEYLLQRYIENPYLIEGKKFDARVYVVIQGVNPIRAYFCNEGLARFCTHNYRKPNKDNLKNVYMHLTNYSINKKSKRFCAPGDEFKTNQQSHKQLFTSVLKNLMAQGVDVKDILKQIYSLSQKTVIALQPYIKNAYHCFISKDHRKSRSFQILGLDILLDDKLQVWLMEVNANPSLNVYTDTLLSNGDIEQNLSELDKYVKTNLVSDTLRLITTPEELRPQDIGCLKQILPATNNEIYEELEPLYLYSNAEEIFEYLSGQQGYDFLTNNQFCKLSRFPEMSTFSVSKQHYELIYKTVVLRSDNHQMDLNCFFEAIEEIANRLYGSKDSYENLVQFIEGVKKHLPNDNQQGYFDSKEEQSQKDSSQKSTTIQSSALSK